MIISFLLLIFYLIYVYLLLKRIYNGKLFYLLIYFTTFLPIYFLFQLIVYKFSDIKFLVDLIKYSKDFVIFSSFILIVFGSKQIFFQRKIKTTFLDKIFILFSILSISYCMIPIGESTFLNKLLYLKNIIVMSVVYFLGRNFKINSNQFNILKRILVFILITAFFTSSIEYFFGTHIHSLLNYEKYNLDINDIISTGNFGLSWTFERSPIHPRFGSIFPNPLEYSSNLLLFLTIPLYSILKKRENIGFNFFLFFIVLLSFYFAYSRASIISALIIVTISLFLTKNYKIIYYLFFLFLFSTLIFILTASQDSIYFLIDTFTFKESSSFSHLIEWIQAILTIIDNPFGIGLAMSGNASGVDQAIKIGGENQFLIYGVQMGVFSIILYSVMLFKSIKDSYSVFNSYNGYVNELSFIVLLSKIGLLIPLLTANAELYLFVSLTTWFLVGITQSYYQKII